MTKCDFSDKAQFADLSKGSSGIKRIIKKDGRMDVTSYAPIEEEDLEKIFQQFKKGRFELIFYMGNFVSIYVWKWKLNLVSI